ncbi:hypothetical protein M501DRAFT_930266 [Patellaria atrata CBS 101060]|uniref:MutL C-terminal dimerisation domain-containing protein n=1 Tax=Patellaria atrata CBS 101060 TaxID=1346257 RepID=A0A9P4SDC8_9PEZI|nr:hypothetical protein M501DRAFT_930266 [Patellaria atrata CBS 101060]
MESFSGKLRKEKPISPLSPEVIAKLKSSTTITTLTGVILELAKNSLDADSTRIEVSVDFRRGGCIVEDNGFGIFPDEFTPDGGLGKLHHTSKFHVSTPKYGRNGNYLASLSALSLLTITSHHYLHRSTNTLTLHQSRLISRAIPAPAQHELLFREHGTRVTVRNLFGNMPVRVKQRAAVLKERAEMDKEWDHLKLSIVALLLAYNKPICLRTKDAEKSRSIVLNGDLSPAPNIGLVTDRSSRVDLLFRILTQASYIIPDDRSSCSPIAASTSSISIRGVIFLKPSPSKQIQFLSLGMYPLSPESGHNPLFDEVNRLFHLSDFGTVEDELEIDEMEKERRKYDKRFKSNGYTNRNLKRANKWPMFSLQIKVKDSTHNVTPGDLFDSESSMKTITDVLSAMITEWLSAHHFRPRKSAGRKQSQRNRDQETDESFLQTRLSFAQEADNRPSTSPEATGRKRKRTISATVPTNMDTHSGKHTSQRESFGDWSRIKSGSTSFYKKVWAPGEVTKNSVIAGKTSASKAAPFKVPNISLGELNDGTRTPSETPRTSPIDERTIDDYHEHVCWTDPLMKRISLINPRTGAVGSNPFQTTKSVSQNLDDQGMLSTTHSMLSLADRNGGSLTTSGNQWLGQLLGQWENPIFKPNETLIPQAWFDNPVSDYTDVRQDHATPCSHGATNIALKDNPPFTTSQISKRSLKTSRIIAQVDKKFILAATHSLESSVSLPNRQTEILILIDQHAADERIRIESLLVDLSTPISSSSSYRTSLGHVSRIAYTVLDVPIRFQVSVQETELFRRYAPFFADWGICFEFSSTVPSQTSRRTKHLLVVNTLPAGIAGRCKATPKLLIELLREEVWRQHARPNRVISVSSPFQSEQSQSEKQDMSTDAEPRWLKRIQDCPPGIIEMLNSRACRSAIMFNDTLSRKRCRELVDRLAECAFPFVCAHGRPSMVPLIQVCEGEADNAGEVRYGFGEERRELGDEQGDFVNTFTRWRKTL